METIFYHGGPPPTQLRRRARQISTFQILLRLPLCNHLRRTCIIFPHVVIFAAKRSDADQELGKIRTGTGHSHKPKIQCKPLRGIGEKKKRALENSTKAAEACKTNENDDNSDLLFASNCFNVTPLAGDIINKQPPGNAPAIQQNWNISP